MVEWGLARETRATIKTSSKASSFATQTQLASKSRPQGDCSTAGIPTRTGIEGSRGDNYEGVWRRKVLYKFIGFSISRCMYVGQNGLACRHASGWCSWNISAGIIRDNSWQLRKVWSSVMRVLALRPSYRVSAPEQCSRRATAVGLRGDILMQSPSFSFGYKTASSSFLWFIRLYASLSPFMLNFGSCPPCISLL